MSEHPACDLTRLVRSPASARARMGLTPWALNIPFIYGQASSDVARAAAQLLAGLIDPSDGVTRDKTRDGRTVTTNRNPSDLVGRSKTGRERGESF